MASFPPEIVQQFIVHLNKEKEPQQHLCSCSNVSRTWYQIAQPLLYHQVAIELDNEERAQSLINILSKSPHIRGYIHRLAIKVSFVPAKNFPPILSALGTLPSLGFLQITSSLFRVNFADDPNLEASLHPILRSQNLRAIKLRFLDDFPVKLFSLCRSLEHLSIGYATLSVSTSNTDHCVTDSECPPERQIFLKSFFLYTTYMEVGDIYDHLQSPQSPFDLFKLQTFVGLDHGSLDERYDGRCGFISRVSPYLKTLLISPANSSLSEGVQDHLGSLDVHKLQGISTLIIPVIQDSDPTDERNTLPWLVTLLSNWTKPENLHTLVLLCNIWTTSEDDWFSTGWPELDEVLCRFQNLRNVNVECYDEPDQQVAQDILLWLVAKLPKSKERGILSVAYFTEPFNEEEIEKGLEERYMN